MDEDKILILKLWKMGLSKMAVTKQFMKEHNKKIKQDKDLKRIDITESLKIVEPILFEYETERMKI